MKILNIVNINNYKYNILFLFMIIGLNYDFLNIIGAIVSVLVILISLYKMRNNDFKNVVENIVVFFLSVFFTLIVFNSIEEITGHKSLNTRIIVPILSLILMFIKREFKYKEKLLLSFISLTTFLIFNFENILLSIISSVVLIIYIIRYNLIKKWHLKNLYLNSNGLIFINYFVLMCICLNNIIERVIAIQQHQKYLFNYEAILPLIIINVIYVIISPLLRNEEDMFKR